MDEASASKDVGSESNDLHTRKQQQQQMGEDTGVARSGPSVVLASDTATLGRRCDNSTCLAIEGIGVKAFKRCGACKQRWYCSAHCQRTDWAKKHARDCPTLTAELQVLDVNKADAITR